MREPVAGVRQVHALAGSAPLSQGQIQALEGALAAMVARQAEWAGTQGIAKMGGWLRHVLTGLRGWKQVITERKLHKSSAKKDRLIRNIADAIPILVSYWDCEQHCRFSNQAYQKWWGISARALRSISLRELLGESLYATSESAIQNALAGKRQHFARIACGSDGRERQVLLDYIPDRDAQGKVLGFIALTTDITAVKLADAEVRLAAAVFQNLAEAIMVTDSDGVIRSVNPAFTEITGFSAQEAIGQTPGILRSDRHDASFHDAIWRQLAKEGQWKGEVWNRRKNGEVFLEWQTITKIANDNNEAIHYVAVFHDITDVWQINEDNRHRAFHDALTKLPNRALLLERLEHRINKAQRGPLRLAVMFLDLDGFKGVNDALGHAVGDELLIVVARKLQSLVRQTDTVARMGGDEFVIKLDNPTCLEEVLQVAERVISAINETVDIAGHRLQVGVSVGIAMYPERGTTALELIKHADTAMYAAKRGGKNACRLYVSEALPDAHA